MHTFNMGSCCSAIGISKLTTGIYCTKEQLKAAIQGTIKKYSTTKILFVAITSKKQRDAEQILRSMGFRSSVRMCKDHMVPNKNAKKHDTYNRIKLWYFHATKENVDKALAA